LVEDLGRDGDLCGAGLVAVETQPVTDDLLPARELAFDAGPFRKRACLSSILYGVLPAHQRMLLSVFHARCGRAASLGEDHISFSRFLGRHLSAG